MILVIKLFSNFRGGSLRETDKCVLKVEIFNEFVLYEKGLHAIQLVLEIAPKQS